MMPIALLTMRRHPPERDHPQLCILSSHTRIHTYIHYRWGGIVRSESVCMGGERDRREALGGQVPSYHLYGDEPRRERNSEKKTEKGMDENMTHTTAQPIFMISSERAQRLSVCNSSLIMISKTRVTREKGKRRKKKRRNFFVFFFFFFF